jgi:glycosyltransferase involved in cell wall biosynthesis
VYGFLQLFYVMVERLTRHDAQAFLLLGIKRVARRAQAEVDFDIIAGKSPDFRILEAAAELALIAGKPFLAVFDDPHGKRDDHGFYPSDRARQIAVLDQAVAVLFMSPTTRDRYVESGLVDVGKCLTITDSFSQDPGLYVDQRQPAKAFRGEGTSGDVSLVHLGNLPEWRPIDTLLDAILLWHEECGSRKLCIHQYGYVASPARDQIRGSTTLSDLFHLHSAISYQQSHHVAGRSDALLVVIGARHLDNQPSKFFDYLGHGKPLLVIGPIGNPVQAIVENLGIGVFCDVRDPTSILTGIRNLVSNFSGYLLAHERHRVEIETYSAKSVADDWIKILDSLV